MSTVTAFDQDDGDEKHSSWDRLVHPVKNWKTNSSSEHSNQGITTDSDANHVESTYDYPDQDLGYFGPDSRY